MSFHMSATIGELAKALAAAQIEITPAKRESVNPHFKSRYADLASCWDAVRGPLAKHGLALSQLVGGDGDTVRLTTMLIHSSGEFIGSDAVLRLTKHDPASVGSALTYLRRYGLSAVCGLSSEDDDGASAATPATATEVASTWSSATPTEKLKAATALIETAFPGAKTTYTPMGSGADGDPSCPVCGNRMWDNRGTPEKPKANPKAPDFKCRDKACTGVIWPPRGAKKPAAAAPPPPPPPPSDDDAPQYDEEIPF